MLEVHPPHHAASTWRDFLIHIATIVIGLLIAVGLEQTVEYVHHREQRHRLQEDLHGESLRVHAALQRNFRTMAVERTWLLALRQDVDTMRASGGKIKLPYRPRPAFDPEDPRQRPLVLSWPPDGVWRAAKESALVPLLPQWQAEIYGALSRQQDLLAAAITAWITEQTNLIGFETQFDDGGPASTPDLARMTPAQLDQYSALLSKNLALRDTVVNRSTIYDASVVAVLDGVRSKDQILEYIMNQHPNFER
jgi:hypothetical protein